VLVKLDKLSHADPPDTELAQIRRLTRDLQHLGDGIVNLPMARAMNKQLDAVLEKRDTDSLNLVLTEMKSLRNAAVHGTIPNSPDTVRPVYSLEEDSDGE
jgi:hypothetical protein